MAYSDPDRKASARHELATLKQRKAPFYQFCAHFVRLASESSMPRSEWVYELNKRLDKPLRKGLLPYYMEEGITFDRFRSYGSRVATELAQISRDEARSLTSNRRAPDPPSNAPRREDNTK